MKIHVIAVLIASLWCHLLPAQILPYTSQLRTDPGVGNLQGIQRLGRPERTDPDQGTGFTYHVFPVSQSKAKGRERFTVIQTDATLTPTGSDTQTETQSGTVETAPDAPNELTPVGNETAPDETPPDDPTAGGDGGASSSIALSSSYPQAASFDWTAGIRNFGHPSVPPMEADTGLQSGVVSRKGLTTKIEQIYHQPLIQIKMRVVDVSRGDSLTVGSILEYVSQDNSNPSLTTGQTANAGAENFRSISRFVASGLATNSTTGGSGALVNLTSEHINWLIQGLSAELNADVITAPEVVTLNGQNVEFVAGSKLPFQLGQNVIQGTNNNIQQVFYKHVGTMVSVTPRIVSWGYHGEGQGERSIQASDVVKWSKLVKEMAEIDKDPAKPVFVKPDGKSIQSTLTTFNGKHYIPYSAQSEILLALNNYSKGKLERLIPFVEMEIIDEDYCKRCNDWKPEDCTIDLAVVVRLSEGTPSMVISDPDDPKTATLSGGSENNIRAVANVIQVKSGHGVVMAGLIGEQESEAISKVPVLGDLPLVGALFRSKDVFRGKSEVLIFIEACVLDPQPIVARAESARDFLLSQAYVEGSVLDNPLEIGMHRAGFGSYLPPHTKGECLYWNKYHRELRKARTHINDALEP